MSTLHLFGASTFQHPTMAPALHTEASGACVGCRTNRMQIVNSRMPVATFCQPQRLQPRLHAWP
jgi:hypothetical protein